MLDFFVITILTALLTAFIYLWFTKIKVWEYLQIHADGWLERVTHKRSERLNEFFSCIFCCGMLISAIIAIVLAIVLRWWYIFVPVFALPLIRRWG